MQTSFAHALPHKRLIKCPTRVPDLQASGEEWKAEYDYTAADEDEVSFAENDIFINVETVDEGWVKVRLRRLRPNLACGVETKGCG